MSEKTEQGVGSKSKSSPAGGTSAGAANSSVDQSANLTSSSSAEDDFSRDLNRSFISSYDDDDDPEPATSASSASAAASASSSASPSPSVAAGSPKVANPDTHAAEPKSFVPDASSRKPAAVEPEARTAQSRTSEALTPEAITPEARTPEARPPAVVTPAEDDPDAPTGDPETDALHSLYKQAVHLTEPEPTYAGPDTPITKMTQHELRAMRAKSGVEVEIKVPFKETVANFIIRSFDELMQTFRKAGERRLKCLDVGHECIHCGKQFAREPEKGKGKKS